MQSVSTQSMPAPQTYTSAQSLASSVQGISLATPNLINHTANMTQATSVVNNVIASIINSPSTTSNVQVISSGGHNMPTQSQNIQCSAANSLSNALFKSVTLVKRKENTAGMILYHRMSHAIWHLCYSPRI